MLDTSSSVWGCIIKLLVTYYPDYGSMVDFFFFSVSAGSGSVPLSSPFRRRSPAFFWSYSKLWPPMLWFLSQFNPILLQIALKNQFLWSANEICFHFQGYLWLFKFMYPHYHLIVERRKWNTKKNICSVCHL